MCGRFASARKRQELLEEFQVQRDQVTKPLEPDYNVAPTRRVYAVLSRQDSESSADGAAPVADGAAPAAAGTLSAGDGAPSAPAGPPSADQQDGVRELRVVRWGLVPFWAKDISIGNRMINARAETVAEKPAFRRAFARRRCLIPADGYYEWMKVGDPDHPRKQPYFIHRADGGILSFAGLYELWRDKDLPDDHPDSWLWTATIITTTAEDEIGQIHDRMPMVIDSSRWADWLDPAATSPEDLRGLLVPALSAHLASHPVSTEVNSVRHNGPGLMEPIATEAEPAGASPAPAPRAAGSGPEEAARSASGKLF
jgi:putative SOS response-associated peptidase YedK